MTASKDETLAVEHSRLGVVSQIDGHRVAPSGIVNLLQAFRTDGDELRLIIGGTTRFGIPLHTSRPEDIRLALSHTVDITLQFLVGIDGHLFHKIIIAVHRRKGVMTAVFSVFCCTDQVGQHPSLQQLSIVLMPLQGTLTGNKDFSYNLSQSHFMAQFRCKGTIKLS